MKSLKFIKIGREDHRRYRTNTLHFSSTYGLISKHVSSYIFIDAVYLGTLTLSEQVQQSKPAHVQESVKSFVQKFHLLDKLA